MITTKIQPFDRDVSLVLDSWTGPAARAALLADAAGEILAEANAQNDSAVGQPVPYATFVDGARTELLVRVKADGTIVRTWDLLPIVLTEIGDLLWHHSPVLTGRYQRSHRLLADGDEIAQVTENWTLPALPVGVQEFVFIPTVDYARLLEPVDGRRAWSSKAPDGVYHVVAEMMKPLYGALAGIAFDYRELASAEETRSERRARPYAPRDLRQPVIVVRPH